MTATFAVVTILPMRIGIDARLPYYQMGGISQSVLHLLPALAEVDSENEYIVLHSRKDGRSYLPSAPNFTRQNLWTPCHHKLERWALGGELLRLGLDVLHSPDFIPPQFGAKRRIITVHDLNFIYYPEFLTPESLRYYADQIAWAVDAADHIAADSHATRHDLIEHLHVPPQKVTTVHLAANPVYQQNFDDTAVSATLQKYNLPRGFILCVGTLEPRKNIPFLIDAYRKLRIDSEIDVPLVLIGRKGWIYDTIFQTIANYNLTDSVIHLEGIFDEELAHFYHGAGVLVTPSHYEGFGLPALEAMHCGCPVIVSNRGSLPEIAGSAGLVLDVTDEAEWAEALHRVLSDSDLRATMAEKGFAQAATFSWRNTAVLMQKLYLNQSV